MVTRRGIARIGIGNPDRCGRDHSPFRIGDYAEKCPCSLSPCVAAREDKNHHQKNAGLREKAQAAWHAFYPRMLRGVANDSWIRTVCGLGRIYRGFLWRMTADQKLLGRNICSPP